MEQTTQRATRLIKEIGVPHPKSATGKTLRDDFLAAEQSDRLVMENSFKEVLDVLAADDIDIDVFEEKEKLFLHGLVRLASSDSIMKSTRQPVINCSTLNNRLKISRRLYTLLEMTRKQAEGQPGDLSFNHAIVACWVELANGKIFTMYASWRSTERKWCYYAFSAHSWGEGCQCFSTSD